MKDQTILGWEEGDVVKLKYNGANRELSILINDQQDDNSVLNVPECEQGFRAVLVLGSTQDKAELLQ